MNNLEKFAAQRLTKQQMSQVKGGTLFMCTFLTSSNQKAVQYIEAPDSDTAETELINGGGDCISNVKCIASLQDGPNL